MDKPTEPSAPEIIRLAREAASDPSEPGTARCACGSKTLSQPLICNVLD
jgi:hypothetical protein